MSQHPDFSQTVSLKLSEVLSDIHVNEWMRLKRRRMFLLEETMVTNIRGLLEDNISSYSFGSQTEGATTIGLASDVDILVCKNNFNVIQELSERQPGRKNVLVIQDETTSPGRKNVLVIQDETTSPSYCLLQILRPLSAFEHVSRRHFTISRDRLLLKNTYLRLNLPGFVMNGPATTRPGQPNTVDQDIVEAFHCKSWPLEARPWLVRQGIGGWPTEKMKRDCETTGYFVVPVSSKSGLYEDLEWRISTSLAERHLMFSLNITQLRCYILMKMILKTFINPRCDGVLSSFMCKNVLFHCIQNTHSSNWQPPNLLACLKCCLIELHYFVRQVNCPHFIIPENNLMAGRISPHNKHKILEILQNIIQSEGHALPLIPIDDLGKRLQKKMNMAFQYWQPPVQMYAIFSKQLLFQVARATSVDHREHLKLIMHDGNETVQERLSDFILTLTRTYTDNEFNSLEKSALKILALPLSSSLGSVIASHDIYTTHRISQEALDRFSVGLNSDVASGRLKLASALYCVGDMERAESVLSNIEEKYDLNIVEPVCACYGQSMRQVRQGFENKCNTGNEELIQHITAFCVRFLRCEINCVPKELQYEMFRSTPEEVLERDEIYDCLMDWAVVDSFPYLYFLKYKTYRALQRVADKKRALADLARTIDTKPNLRHRETALNLLGQCMEQENRHADALHCYMISQNFRARNNAAKVLICRLLNALVNMQQNVLN